MVNAIFVFYEQWCDPKFSCFGTFKILTLAVFVCSAITVVSMFFSHYIYCFRQDTEIKSKSYIILIGSCLFISAATSKAISVAETIGITASILGWAIISFLLGILAFKLGQKI